MDVAKIEEKIDRTVASTVPVDVEFGGLALENLGQVMEFAKLMSVSGAAVPEYLRGNPGACLAICSRAMRWKMDPFAVAEQSYMVTNRGTTSIAYMSQLVHAVIESRAPLKNRLRHEIVSEGDERRCKVWATFKGEDEPHVYLSQPLAKMLEARPKRKDGPGFGGSPLWETNPEVQMFYSASRQWARLFSPDTLLGVYAIEELPDDTPIDVTPQADLVQRLRNARAAGDKPGSDATIEGEAHGANDEADAGSNSEPDDQTGGGDSAGAEQHRTRRPQATNNKKEKPKAKRR